MHPPIPGKIFHIINSLERGGAQEVLLNVCENTRFMYEHRVFFIHGKNSYANVKNSILANSHCLNGTNLYNLLRAAFLLARCISNERTHVCLQGWLYQANLLALFVKLVSPRSPVVFSIHNGSDRSQFTSMSGFLASRICGLFSGMVKSTIFVSKKSLASHVPYKHSVVIPNPIKPLGIAADAKKPRTDHFPQMVTLACVARLDPVKNIGFMLDVVQRLGAMDLSVRLLMAGEGMLATNSELMAMLRARGLEDRVELLGVVSDIASVYLCADYTILTSKCESFSNVLLESIASGTPFISSDVGIAIDLVSPESFVIKGYDVADWVARLQNILQVRKSAVTSQSVRQHYERISTTYAPGRIAQLYADCWAKAMDQ